MTIYYVSPIGNDTASGSSADPFKTLQNSVTKLKAGDVLNVRAGSYGGFTVAWDTSGVYGPISGTATAPITIQADPTAVAGSVIINNRNLKNHAAIDFEPGPNYITIKGFVIVGNSDTNYGIRFAQSIGVQILDNVISNITNGFGIFTSKTTNCLIQGNTVFGVKGSNTTGHGIYVSNSAVRPIVRDNIIFKNGGEGLHLNGDVSQGGVGMIDSATVINNVIHNNTANGINCDGIKNSIIKNNLIYANGNHGFTFYKIDGSAGSTNNIITNNTIYQPQSGGAAIKLMDKSTGNIVNNNILIGGSTYGTYNYSTDSLTGLVTDNNVVVDKFVNETTGVTSNFLVWKATGKDTHSLIATGTALFVDSANEDFHLKIGSPAIGAGTNGVNIGYIYPIISPSDTTPPVISNIIVSNITASSANISWTTDESSDTTVEYGTSSTYGTSVTNATLATTHSVNLTGLQSNTQINYRVASKDASGNISVSVNFTLQTLPLIVTIGELTFDHIPTYDELKELVRVMSKGDLTRVNSKPDYKVDAFDLNKIASNWQSIISPSGV